MLDRYLMAALGRSRHAGKAIEKPERRVISTGIGLA